MGGDGNNLQAWIGLLTPGEREHAPATNKDGADSSVQCRFVGTAAARSWQHGRNEYAVQYRVAAGAARGSGCERADVAPSPRHGAPYEDDGTASRDAG